MSLQSKESIILPIYKMDGRANCTNLRKISLFCTTYKIPSNILLSILPPHVEEFVKKNEYRFQRKRSDTDKKFSVFQILEKNGNSVH